MTTRNDPIPVQAYARTCGFLYLYIVFVGIFSETFVRSRLVVPSDPGATAANILANETLFRLGFAGELLQLAFDVVIAVLAMQLHADAYGIALVFFGFACLALGYLIFRSGYLPKSLGVLMFVAGVGYLVNSFGRFLDPAFGLAEEMRAYFLARQDTPDWEIAFTHAIYAHCAHAAGEVGMHRAAYQDAARALAAVADEEDRSIVAETFGQVPAP